MATPLAAGSGGITNQNNIALGMYALGDGTNGTRTDVFGNVEIKNAWAGATSASLSLANPSEYLVVNAVTAAKNIGITINSNAAATADGSTASMMLAPNVPALIPMRGVRNLNIIASSGSSLISVANFF